MKRTILKIITVLLVIVLLPVFFYFSERLTSLSKNEQVIQDAFSKQLESILFSINQYSENIIKQWSNSVDLPINSQTTMIQNVCDHLLEVNPAIDQISFYNLENNTLESEYYRENKEPINVIPLIPSDEKLKDLKIFLKSNYQKIETIRNNNKAVLYFLTSNSVNEKLIFLTVDIDLFFTEGMRPEMQRIAQDMFAIQVFNKIDNKTLLSTEKGNFDAINTQNKDLWYFPDYELQIRLKSQTIQEMVTERSRKENYVLLVVLLIVVAGAIFIVSNIQKEIKLADLKSEFVSNVSHEIRTPLASISMYTETLMLDRVKNDDRKKEYLKIIHQETLRLSDMVNRILNFSRLEKSKRKFHFEPIDMNSIIPNVLKSFEAQLENNKVTYTFNPTNKQAKINADRDAMVEVLINLIDNAIKYGNKTKPEITIKTIAEGEKYIIEIEDNGIGISPKDKKYIFDKFYRVTKGDLALHAKGSGLGLNIVYQIIKEHHAQITVQSKLGEGSCFRLIFPVIKNDNHG